MITAPHHAEHVVEGQKEKVFRSESLFFVAKQHRYFKKVKSCTNSSARTHHKERQFHASAAALSPPERSTSSATERIFFIAWRIIALDEVTR
jgi:hypothetical protein